MPEMFSVSVRYLRHKKTRQLRRLGGDRLVLKNMEAWSYAAEWETGGLIRSDDLTELKLSESDVAKLIACGLWDQNGEGWYIHDWHENQEWLERYVENRRREREKKRRQRDAAKGRDVP